MSKEPLLLRGIRLDDDEVWFFRTEVADWWSVVGFDSDGGSTQSSSRSSSHGAT